LFGGGFHAGWYGVLYEELKILQEGSFVLFKVVRMIFHPVPQYGNDSVIIKNKINKNKNRDPQV